MTQPARSPQGVVAAGHPLTAEAGAEMLRLGGNAFDAAIAAVLTACVTESVLTSLGGGGFLLAQPAAHAPILFDFFSQTPHRRRPAEELDFYPIAANFGDTTQEFHIGLGAIAVPGVPLGLLRVHQKLGRLPWAELIAPARHWAKTGLELGAFQAYCFRILQPILTATPAARALYAPHGTLLQAGDRLYLPEFAATLDHLCEEGFETFYTGDLAAQLVADCQTHGGYLTAADLAQYQVIERSPLAIPYRDRVLLTNPPPSSGGALIGFALQLLATQDMTALTWGSPAHVAVLREIMALTNVARRDGYDDRLYETDVGDRFLAAPHVAEYAAQLPPSNKWGSTTHISVLDREGNAASVTTSNGEGSSYVLPGTSIMLNNMLGEEDLNPAGWHQWHPNRRISSMMAPSLLLHQGQPEAVLGSGGSNRIRTALLQVISNLVDFQMPLTSAVTAPRLHWEREHLHLEPGLVWADAEAVTGDRVTRWQAPNMFFGGVHAALHTEAGDFIAAGDPRRSGATANA